MAPIATATAACDAVERGALRSLECSYQMCAAYTAPLTTHAASRHRCWLVVAAANPLPMRKYARPTRSAARIQACRRGASMWPHRGDKLQVRSLARRNDFRPHGVLRERLPSAVTVACFETECPRVIRPPKDKGVAKGGLAIRYLKLNGVTRDGTLTVRHRVRGPNVIEPVH